MRKINIIYVGGIKAGEKYYRETIDEYAKRLSGEFKIADIEIKEEPLPQNPNASEIAACLFAEGKKILGKAGAGAFKIALCPEGKKLTSEAFASLLYCEKTENSKSLDFIVGSSHGLSGEVKQSADYLLSLSDMTFSHRLARVMLFEQLYRAYAIETGRKYCK
ncbi:MAG: 23S rRNA (pseudouridine(1915)-N(3))-methyltransferase RlmH [Oscillospiraceae bacterium]|nr:23S rRNA (pseudouridine(1915)-N(3))-methyltransferase RlmH [Oscillospiraceae bacterium]